MTQANTGLYRQPKEAKVSGNCQKGKHGVCYNLSCACPCHKGGH